MLERITYVSRAAAGTGLNDVFEIIREAHLRNTAQDISGGLVYLDDTFVQVLEGPRDILRNTYERIAQDPRHMDLSLRSRERALCRLFEGQSMALRTATCLDPGLLEEFEYMPGFPASVFPADDLVEFMVRACWPTLLCTTLDSHRRAS